MIASQIILASASQSRSTVLRNAGLVFEQIPADLDEASIKSKMQLEGQTAANCAQALADAKALHVSRHHPNGLVIGCDQMLACENRWFDKPTDSSSASEQLMALRGKTHSLFNGMAIAQNGQIVWRYTNTAHLRMRTFSPEFLKEYLTHVGQKAHLSVGGYQLEGLGAQLFESIEGDFFSVLGLPLLPLLGYLRDVGAIKS